MSLVSINFHSCFLSIIYAGASYLANDLATEASTYTYLPIILSTYLISAYIIKAIRTFPVVPSVLNYHVSFFPSHHPLDCQHVLRINVRTQAQAVIRKKITLYCNFFRNLDFKNIVNFFKRTCWTTKLQAVCTYTHSTRTFSGL